MQDPEIVTNFFDGLKNYEIVLLILGTVLLCILLAALVPRLIRGSSITSLIPFFLMGVVMIGFPGVAKIQFGEALLETKQDLNKLASAQGTEAEEIKTRISKRLTELEGRPIRSIDRRLVLATAQTQIGQVAKAEENVKAVLERRPASPEALKLRQILRQPRDGGSR